MESNARVTCKRTQHIESDSPVQRSNLSKGCQLGISNEFPEKKPPIDRVRIADNLYIFKGKLLTKQGNVYEGVITSELCGTRPCAVKYGRSFDEAAREATILNKLDHTNIISIIKSGRHEEGIQEFFYLALNKCHELNLRHFVIHHKESHPNYDPSWSFHYIKQILAGMTYVHEKRIVHKDLKPSNILLTVDLETIKIADFGSSQELKSQNSMIFCKHTFGTLGFRPPESFGRQWASLKSDIFSLGAVLYFIMSYGMSPLGEVSDLVDYNTKNGITDFSGLLVPNPKTTIHLIKTMLNTERTCRPTMWEISQHPCWNGEEVDCNFDYGNAEEIDDCDSESEEGEESANESDEDHDEKAFIRAVLKTYRRHFIILFDMVTKKLQRYDHLTQQLTPMHKLHEEMELRLFSAVCIGNYIYVMVENRSFFRLYYSKTQAQWERMPYLINDHGWYPPAAVASGCIYIVGGSGLPFLKTTSKYDPETNQWENMPDQIFAIRNPAAVASENYLYSLGGSLEGIGITTIAERLDLKSLKWEQIASLREAKCAASACSYQGKIYVSGGLARDSVKSMERYDPHLNQWTMLTPMNISRGRGWLRTYHINKSLYTVSGDAFPSQTIERYDFNEDKWTILKVHETMGGMNIDASVLVEM